MFPPTDAIICGNEAGFNSATEDNTFGHIFVVEIAAIDESEPTNPLYAKVTILILINT